MPKTGQPSKLISEPVDDLDEHEFSRVYRAETPWLVRFFRKQLGNVEDARDLAQEAMLRYFRVGPTAMVATPKAYLHRIASNLLRDRFDQSSTKLVAKSRPLLEGLDIPSDVDPHREVADREELERWHAILSELPPRTLEIFLLSRVDGYKYREIAEQLGISTFAVNKHMVRAIAHIDHMRRGQ